jgi:transposase
MFVRIKSTPLSPRKSVQIVESIRKKDRIVQKIVRHVGVAMDAQELEQLKALAETICIKLKNGSQQSLFNPETLVDLSKKVQNQTTDEKFRVNLKDLVEEQRIVVGIHDIYGRLFDELGYNGIFTEKEKTSRRYFKNIVMARIANPKSKRTSVRNLEEDFAVTLNLDMVYRMMDSLTDERIENLQKLTADNTFGLLGQKIDVMFYDVTTIYFESFTSDELRKNGYSKDLKFNQPQILLALLVTKEGLPVGYEIFAGDQYEGHTMLPVLKKIRQRYDLDKIIVVADSGMMNKENIMELKQEGFKFIVGARLKNLSKEMIAKILNRDEYQSVSTDSEFRIAKFRVVDEILIVSFSEKRAKKDRLERERGIIKLKKKLEKQKTVKSHLTVRGYGKFLKITGESNIEIDEEKLLLENQWDGLHGVFTNDNNLSLEEILTQYRNLWHVEEAFRVNKHDLKVRPVYHWTPERVKAHLGIAFMSYVLVAMLEYRVKLQYKDLSPEEIRRNLVKVQASLLRNRKTGFRYLLPSHIPLDAQKIYQIMGVKALLKPQILENL